MRRSLRFAGIKRFLYLVIFSITGLLFGQISLAQTLTVSPQSICLGGSFSLTASGISGGCGKIDYTEVSYNNGINWNRISVGFAGGVCSVTHNPDQVSNNVIYRIHYATSGGGFANSITVSVNAAPSAPTTTGAYICIGSTATLSAYGATSGQLYNWYDAASGGNLLQSSSGNAFVTPVLAGTTNYWVSIQNASGCESAKTLVTAIYPVVSGDDQNRAGTDSWIGHTYKRADAVAQAPTDANAFAYYYGTITESSETFDESFGGTTNCLPLAARESARSINTEYLAIRFRMNSTKKAGIYLADIGSDDGTRLTVDGTLIYNAWVQRGYANDTKVLFQLTETSSLLLEYYESSGGNQVSFQNFLEVPNNLTSGITQTICPDVSAAEIAANNSLTEAPISNDGRFAVTYQWQQSADQVNWSDISGASAQNYTPTGLSAGTNYFRRKLTISRTNPGSITVSAIDYSNTATVKVNPQPSIASQSTSGHTTCLNGSFNPISVSATGTGLTFQWYSNTTASTTGGTNLGNANGAQTNTYTPQASNPGTRYYYCILTGTCGSVTSAVSGAFVVNSPASITTQPTSLSNICLGADQSFTVGTTGTAPLSYQWKKNGVDISGATSSTLSLNHIQAADAANYSVVVSNTCGNVTSNTVTLTLDNTPPVLNNLSSKSQNLGCVTQPVSGGYVINGLGLSDSDFGDNCNSATELTKQYKIVHNSATLIDFGSDADGDASGFAFPEGISTIIYRIKDQNNNTSSEKSFTVEFWYSPEVSEIKMN